MLSHLRNALLFTENRSVDNDAEERIAPVDEEELVDR